MQNEQYQEVTHTSLKSMKEQNLQKKNVTKSDGIYKHKETREKKNTNKYIKKTCGILCKGKGQQ